MPDAIYKTRKRSRTRQTVQISGWGSRQLRDAMQLLARQEGISFSQIVVAFCEEGVRQKLHVQQQILAEPILRKLLREELRPLRNDLSEFHGRSLFEIGQVRWFFINKLWRDDVIHPSKTFSKLTEDAFYRLLDSCRKETLKGIRQWNHTVTEAVAAVRKKLTGEINTHE